MNANYVNLILNSSQDTLKKLQIETIIDKPKLKKINNDNIHISIGIFGDVESKITLSTSQKVGCEIINKMFQGMMEVDSIDDMGKSALAELGNMIAGNTATNFENIKIKVDITTPSIGEEIICSEDILCFPLIFNNNEIETFIEFPKEKVS